MYDKSMKEMTWADDTLTDEKLISYCESNKSRFDVMVLYTGGKDSSYLLWHLASKLKLRVLAATWNMPFMQESAIGNIRSAMKRLPNVEFVQRSVRADELREAMTERMHREGLPCLCEQIAYLLFYPMAIQEKIPLIIDGAEKVQSIRIGSVFSKMAKNAKPGRDRDQTVAELMILLRTLKRLNSGEKKMSFIREADKIIDYVCDEGNDIPIIKHLANTDCFKTWRDIVEIIEKELDWKAPSGQNSLLHTSCKIEKLKDYCQCKLYQSKRSSNFPESMKEISAAVYLGYITREEGLNEIANTGYFAEPECLDYVSGFLNLDRSQMESIGGEFDIVVNGAENDEYKPD
jgi:hypothetical protein